jgi:hypothetical protein
MSTLPPSYFGVVTQPLPATIPDGTPFTAVENFHVSYLPNPANASDTLYQMVFGTSPTLLGTIYSPTDQTQSQDAFLSGGSIGGFYWGAYAYNSGGTSPTIYAPSNAFGTQFVPQPPQPRIAANLDHTFLLTWGAVPGAIAYKIYRYFPGGYGGYPWPVVIDAVDAPTTQYLVTQTQGPYTIGFTPTQPLSSVSVGTTCIYVVTALAANYQESWYQGSWDGSSPHDYYVSAQVGVPGSEQWDTLGQHWLRDDYEYTANLENVVDTPIFKAITAPQPGIPALFGEKSRLAERRLEYEGTLTLPEGTVTSTPHADLRVLKDAFLAAHAPATVGKMLFGKDRYAWATVLGRVIDQGEKTPYWHWEAEFVCEDPFLYSQYLSYQPLTANGSATATAGGNTYAEPYFDVTVVAFTSLPASMMLTNTTTGQVWTFAPVLAGNYIAYFGKNTTPDRDTNLAWRHRVRRVLSATASDMTKYVGGDEGIALLPGDNTITLDVVGMTLSAPTLYWLNRYV